MKKDKAKIILEKFNKMILTFISGWFFDFRLIRDVWIGHFPLNSNGPKVSLSIMEKIIISVLLFIRSFSLVQLKSLFKKYKIRSELSELYVIIWFFFLVYLLFFPFTSKWLLFFIVCYRLIDAFNYRLCIFFVDRYDVQWGLRSLNRSIILILINFFEIIVGFSILYLNTSSIGYSYQTSKIISSPIESIYFSIVTITTVGFGDLIPLNKTGQILVTFEILFGFILIAVIFGLLLTGARFVKEIQSERNKE